MSTIKTNTKEAVESFRASTGGSEIDVVAFKKWLNDNNLHLNESEFLMTLDQEGRLKNG